MRIKRKSLFIPWQQINWALVHKRVRRIQYRIYKSKLASNKVRVHKLQKLLITSLDARLLAVQQVTTINKRKNIAGVDRIISITAEAKQTLAEKLILNGNAESIRRVWISKPGKIEKRSLGILTIIDRAKQALAKLALEPEWEAVFEENSYGFRPGRSCSDAIEAIFLALRHESPQWVYDADIRKCFDKINHEALLRKLDTFPLMEKQIVAWLKAGIMEGYANTSKDVIHTTTGTTQGCIVSPLLANIALHGIESFLTDFVTEIPGLPYEGAQRGNDVKRKAIKVIRYADDFVLIHPDKVILKTCILKVSEWISYIGLEINEEKSKLRDGREGFNFLGFQVIQVVKSGMYKVKIKPSKSSEMKLLAKVREIIQNYKAASSYQLIMILRPLIIGWANYFKYSECTQSFNKISHLIFQKIRAWVFRRDTRNGRLAIKQKYFPNGKEWNFNGNNYKDNWVLYGEYKSKDGIKTTFLPRLFWVKSQKHVKVRGLKSPYDGDHIYWTNRLAKYAGLAPRVKKLLLLQDFKCNICQESFTNFDIMEVDHIMPLSKGGKDRKDNLQLLHQHCHVQKTSTESK
uniref:Putative reverse transcriptase/maturase n=1 Tax=Corynoplastis japonica TaxID=700918 RepID=A0A1X9PTV5_9RHOD|nr:putative reverse transcriptase/maturase [Corynoplastis japonica]